MPRDFTPMRNTLLMELERWQEVILRLEKVYQQLTDRYIRNPAK